MGPDMYAVLFSLNGDNYSVKLDGRVFLVPVFKLRVFYSSVMIVNLLNLSIL